MVWWKDLLEKCVYLEEEVWIIRVEMYDIEIK